eukprot:6029065-Alexandrium_andersonii.AAC.1
MHVPCMRVGEASHPGPAGTNESGGVQASPSEFVIRSINATALRPHFASMLAQCSEHDGLSKVDLWLIQEHSLDPKGAGPLVKAASREGCKLAVGPLCPDKAKPTGGVAALACQRAHLTPCLSRTHSFQKLQAAGRVACVLLDIGLNVPIRCYNCYGWQGGEQRSMSRMLTHQLVAAILED